ncbi:hypothetical protein QO001_002372 [Methylobacterium brachiatum]|jgi:hypothetical protein|uniref:Uncharacterized protein n=1 Tax=Methylobacterium brachiatum TaxID=269660 RepID=A0AAJ1TMI3_9HYPH|nr:hypothetical protein [Methylobacterium brachiatum]
MVILCPTRPRVGGVDEDKRMHVHQEADLAGMDAASFLKGSSGPIGTTVRMSDGSVYTVTRVVGPCPDGDASASPNPSATEHHAREAMHNTADTGPARHAGS